MTDKLQSIIYQIWSSACQDAPIRPSGIVKDGQFVMTVTGNRAQWTDLCKRAGVPSHATQTVEGDVLTAHWPSVADEIFGADGLIAQRLDNYEVRLPQLHMARLCQRAIEMNAPALIEAGTGVGKSYAYAAVCMAMGKKVVISTSNKALQMQLWRKDLPFLCEIFPGKKVALSVGKGNFACRTKCEHDGDVTILNPELAAWYSTTLTGNTEEISFPVNWKDLAAVAVDDECTAKHCPNYYGCFYYDARAKLQGADVVICNHALLCLNELTSGNLLPPAAVTVVDEAHKLPDYARNALGVEFTFNSIERAIGLAQGFSESVGDVDLLRIKFEREISAYLADKTDPQVSVHKAQVFEGGKTLSDALYDLANDVWNEDELPSDAEEVKQSKRADRIRKMAGKVLAVASESQAGMVRWLEPARRDDPLKLCAQPSDVSEFIAKLAGVVSGKAAAEAHRHDYTRCTRCSRTLTAAKVALLDGKPFGPECIHHVDAFGDAEVVDLMAWLAMEHAAAPDVEQESTTYKPTIFTSATLAAPDLSHFLRTCGLPDALQMQAPSPFDYENNAMLYLPNGTSPAPNEQGWMMWAFEQMRRLVLASKGGAFLLFTSYNAMSQAVHELRYTFTARSMTVLVQGEMPKLEIAKRFRSDGNAVLFATKSFFEGVDIQGDALRLVVVDKMPFEAPSPLTQAMEADVMELARAQGISGKALEMYPFNNLRVPRMIIDLKQATGRLIRTQADRGVMVVLDSRIRSAQYGRNMVIPALPPAPVTSHIEAAELFLLGIDPIVPTKRQPLIPARELVPDITLAGVDELAF